MLQAHLLLVVNVGRVSACSALWTAFFHQDIDPNNFNCREKQTERIHEMRKQRIITEGLVVTKRPDNVDSLLHRPPSGPASAEYAAHSQHMPKRPAMQR